MCAIKVARWHPRRCACIRHLRRARRHRSVSWFNPAHEHAKGLPVGLVPSSLPTPLNVRPRSSARRVGRPQRGSISLVSALSACCFLPCSLWASPSLRTERAPARAFIVPIASFRLPTIFIKALLMTMPSRQATMDQPSDPSCYRNSRCHWCCPHVWPTDRLLLARRRYDDHLPYG